MTHEYTASSIAAGGTISVAAILACLGYTLAAMGYGFLATVPPVEAVGRVVSSATARGCCETPTPRPTPSYPASTSSWGSAAPWWFCCGPAPPPCYTRAPFPCGTNYRWCRRSAALSPDPSGWSTWNRSGRPASCHSISSARHAQHGRSASLHRSHPGCGCGLLPR
jgi:hypothetical protein